MLTIALIGAGTLGKQLRTDMLFMLQVGSQFVQQYYTVLHTSPRYLHRFYTDASSMTHTAGSATFTASNQKVSCPN